MFGLLVGVPAVTLELLGLRAVRLERIERRQTIRDQQAQIARFADAAISSALSKDEAAVAFNVDSGGLLLFPADKVYFAPFGARPAGLYPQWPAATKEWIDEALAAEAQQRPKDAAALYRRIAAVERGLRPWAELALARLDKLPVAVQAERARSEALTPSGLPVALVACALAGSDPRFYSLRRSALRSMRAGRWWLSYDERRFHDEELRRALDVLPDPRLDELAEIDRAVRGPAGGAHMVHQGRAISYLQIRTILDTSVAPLLRPPIFRTSIYDGRNQLVWGEADAIEHAIGLRSTPGWEIAFGSPVSSRAADERQLLWYGFVGLLIIVLMFGVALTARTLRREMELRRMQSEFLGAVTHEFKSPITSIRLLMERIASGRVSPADQALYSDAITQETERLERLVDRVLESQKVEAGSRTYRRVPASMIEIAGSVIQRLRPRAETKNIDVTLEAPAKVPKIRLDPAAMSDAVENLIDNAIKYSPSGTRVVVAIEADNGRLSVSVTDAGIGIAKEDLPRVFDWFYRGRSGDLQDVRGAGLGLALVKATVEAHAGAVAVTSIPGKGSRFCLQLPLDIKDHASNSHRG